MLHKFIYNYCFQKSRLHISSPFLLVLFLKMMLLFPGASLSFPRLKKYTGQEGKTGTYLRSFMYYRKKKFKMNDTLPLHADNPGISTNHCCQGTDSVVNMLTVFQK